MLMVNSARAGLVLHIDAGIAGKDISALRFKGSELQVVTRGGVRTIVLPAGTRDDAVRWAEQYQGGPLIVSIESAFGVAVGTNYVPPVIPGGLHARLLRYDGYFSSLACGAMRSDGASRHPLTRKPGGLRQFPAAQYQELLSVARTDETAIWYRRLAARYADPPQCFGETTLTVNPQPGAQVVGVSVQPWLYAATRQWYRGIDSPSTWDHWAALLPYQPLLSDLRNNFDLYRAAFAPVDELSSLLETVAILYAVRTRSPAVWKAFRSALGPESADPAKTRLVRRGPENLSMPQTFDRESWRQWSVAWIGPQVETTAEANLALSLLMDAKLPDDRVQRWIAGVEQAVERDPSLQGKVALVSLLFKKNMGDTEFANELQDLFVLLRRESPTSLRLRAQAIRRLGMRLLWERPAIPKPPTQPAAAPSNTADEEADDAGEDVDPDSDQETRPWQRSETVLENEQDRVISDFVSYALPRCLDTREGRDQPLVWESLLDDIYSVDLLNLAPGHPRQSDLIRAAVCAHFRRGTSIQVGRELAYQHAHFRFLGYLRAYAQTPELRKQIADYRRTLAELMGLRAWEEARYDR